MPSRELAAYGGKRLEDMTKEDLITALKQVHERHLMILGERLSSNDLPIFNADMETGNKQLMMWFMGNEATKPNDLDDDS
ncbi:hypothetical protein UFOVP235_35 [uncultured Caudovirales phage]|uniref:Uncharacterized protein n=1 Tax=uncultured Caudovirales phage TaxID=2100421 RepID=A0A6J7WZ78_9CAUD|nr:hypothetical protein UFOVP235_35 [uncultured Caudovirales phage]